MRMYIQISFLNFYIHSRSARGAAALFPVASPFTKATTKPKVFIMPRRSELKKENKTEVLPPCRVTKSERVLIKEKAAEAGLSLSEYERQALIDSVIVKPQNVLDVNTVMKLSEIGSSLKYIAPISNNLNQLVRKTHIHDETDIERMKEILDQLENVDWKEIKNDLEKIVIGLVDGS